ncbi:MAG: type II toxin-antitoxin system PemK/MazF family toxin [Dehalococcoidia bacterium]|nr:type II toxin-antitoxin system PemK/MazF family toxin [Dehalococcoidia bacterium]MCA9844862.1 type II toxin-antitoxin system PemK/MazF family toxin [Dehalococcoidia bacterium]
MVVTQGDVWWADLDEPAGSAPGYRRPVLVVQGDALNQSRIATVICVALTTNMRLADAPGNVVLPSSVTGLPHDSVAKVSEIITLDKSELRDWTGRLSARRLALVHAGIDIVLGRR